MMGINTIIFDLGGVLIDWNPRYVYRTIFKTEPEVEWFLENITTSAWNEEQDAGYPISKAVEEKVSEFPEWENEIRAYYGRWTEMLHGAIPASVGILKSLKENKELKLYALTNWSAELFPIALERFDFLHWFDGRVVSGEEKLKKPYPEFYRLILDRFKIDPAKALFIDDSLRNIKGAESLGIKSIYFKDPGQLKEELAKYHLP